MKKHFKKKKKTLIYLNVKKTHIHVWKSNCPPCKTFCSNRSDRASCNPTWGTACSSAVYSEMSVRASTTRFSLLLRFYSHLNEDMISCFISVLCRKNPHHTSGHGQTYSLIVFWHRAELTVLSSRVMACHPGPEAPKHLQHHHHHHHGAERPVSSPNNTR